MALRLSSKTKSILVCDSASGRYDILSDVQTAYVYTSFTVPSAFEGLATLALQRCRDWLPSVGFFFIYLVLMLEMKNRSVPALFFGMEGTFRSSRSVNSVSHTKLLSFFFRQFSFGECSSTRSHRERVDWRKSSPLVWNGAQNFNHRRLLRASDVTFHIFDLFL